MRQIQKGSVDRSVDLYIIDSTDGTPEVGVLWNTAGIDLKYRRDLSAVVSITEATLATLTTAHTDGGFLEIGNGVYRLDLPDAAWATGADHVTIFGTVTGMIVLPVTVQLVDYDPEVALATQTSVNTIDDFLDTEIAAILAAVDTEIADIQSRLPAALVGGRMNSSVGAVANDAITAAGLAADASTEIAAAVNTVALVESYRVNGAQGTLTQLLYEILAHLTEASIAGTTKTIKKIDHVTVAATATLDNATAPTSITRAT